MGSRFNNGASGPSEPESGDSVPAAGADAPTSAPSPDSSESAAVVRFRSCRWMQPEEDGNAAFCTHREVKPYAGTTGFDPEAWCPECQYYKLRRTPKRRSEDLY